MPAMATQDVLLGATGLRDLTQGHDMPHMNLALRWTFHFRPGRHDFGHNVTRT